MCMNITLLAILGTIAQFTSPLFQAGLRPILESFAAALVTVQGKNCQPEDQLVRSSSKKRGQPSPAAVGETLTAAMYLRKVGKYPDIRTCVLRMTV